MAKYSGPEFDHCDRCPMGAGQLVEFDSGRQEALCFTCWNPIRTEVKVLHWINRYGRLMFAPGVTKGPFRVEHP